MTIETPENNRDMFCDLFDAAVENEAVAGARVVACITDGHSSAFGYNKLKSHPFQKRFSQREDRIHLHAEIDAILNWGRFYDLDALTECDMYVMRVKRDGRGGRWITGLAKPCEGCSRAIATFGISSVYYTTDKSRIFTCL